MKGKYMTWQAYENYSRYREGSTLGKRQLKYSRGKKDRESYNRMRILYNDTGYMKMTTHFHGSNRRLQ